MRELVKMKQGGSVRLLQETLARIGIYERKTGRSTADVEAELDEILGSEKPGTFSADFNRAKGALAKFEIALAGPGLPRQKVISRAAEVQAAWLLVHGQAGFQVEFRKRLSALCPIGEEGRSNDRVTREDRQLTRNSFEAIQDVAQPMVMLFYGKLFELDPSLKAMFTAPMKDQAAKLVATLQVAVDSLDNLEPLLPKLRNLGQQHADYGVEPRHYELVEQSLIWAITGALEGGCSPATRTAWQALLRAISAEMIAGATTREGLSVTVPRA